MGIVVSLILIGAGAILVWAVTGTVTGVDLDVVGVILMIVGVLALFLTLIFWSSWWGPGGARAVRRRTYVTDDPYAQPVEPAPRTRTVVEEEEAGPPPGPPP